MGSSSGTDGWYRLATGVGRVVLRGLRLTTRWEGLEHLPTRGPVILAATHVSYPDFVFIQRAAGETGRRVRYMCRHDVWHNRWVARPMDRMRHIPVDRQAPAAAYLAARRLLGQGEAICAFPEAGVSFSYTVRPLMRG
ncbi:1-acyl-sn-glycerol-3-phosphate acyltransferase, partial [Nocardioides sp.]|uniref:lysophospholipid acyltransferase family protein n=1 Tax=Nocardioides sp. TaxID=35761 RepID=UPI002732738D